MNPQIVIANNFWHREEAGGAYKISTDFALRLAREGRVVHYVCMSGDGSASGERTESGVRIWSYPRAQNGGGTGMTRFFRHLRHMRRIAGLILKELPANSRLIVNGHNPLQYLGLLRAFPQRIVMRKVASVHSPMAEEFRESLDGPGMSMSARVKYLALSYIENRFYESSDVIQCDSRYTESLIRKLMRARVADRIVICPGYVETDRFAPSAEPKTVLRRKLTSPAWNTDATVFFCLRRHVRRMGIDTLIHAAARLRSQASGRPFRVIIGGDGPLRPELEALSAELDLCDLVHFTGKIPESDLPSCYQAADCFVLPTRALECFGLILLESLACGTPVIATPVGSIPEVLGGLRKTCMAAGAKPDDIALAMQNFLSAPRQDPLPLVRHAKTYEKEKVLAELEALIMGEPVT